MALSNKEALFARLAPREVLFGMWMMLVFTVNSLLNFVVSLLVAKFLGPAEYGRFVLALSASVVIQLLLFDWLRFRGDEILFRARPAPAPERARDARRRLRLDRLRGEPRGLWRLCVGPRSAAVARFGRARHRRFRLQRTVRFRLRLAARAFLDKSYALLVVAKNALAFTLTVGGAFWFGSARVAIVGMMVSVLGALFAGRGGLIDEAARDGRAERALGMRFLAYGMPIISANIVYQSVPLLNRVLVRNRSASPKPDNIRSPMRSAFALSARSARRST